MEKTTLIKIGTHIGAGFLGAVIGGMIVHHKTSKRYYDDLESVRAYYRSKKVVDIPKADPKPVVEKKISSGSEDIRKEYVAPGEAYTAEFIDYRKFAKDIQETPSVQEDTHVNTEAPYQISVSEFGDLEGYDEKTFTYFSNGIITDEVFSVIDQPDDILGDYKTLLEESGYQEPIYIRNPITMTDYCLSPIDKEYYLE